MRHIPFILILALFVLTVGQTVGHFSAALMIAAYVRHDGRLFSPI